MRGRPRARAGLIRLDLGADFAGEWTVWLPDDAREWVAPVPPDGFSDRLAILDPQRPPEFLVQSARLSGDAVSYEQLVGFGGVEPDELGGRLEAFSTREVFREP